MPYLVEQDFAFCINFPIEVEKASNTEMQKCREPEREWESVCVCVCEKHRAAKFGQYKKKASRKRVIIATVISVYIYALNNGEEKRRQKAYGNGATDGSIYRKERERWR